MKITQFCPGRFCHAIGVNLGGTVTANASGEQQFFINAVGSFDRLRVVEKFDVGDLSRFIRSKNLSGAKLLQQDRHFTGLDLHAVQTPHTVNNHSPLFRSGAQILDTRQFPVFCRMANDAFFLHERAFFKRRCGATRNAKSCDQQKA